VPETKKQNDEIKEATALKIRNAGDPGGSLNTFIRNHNRIMHLQAHDGRAICVPACRNPFGHSAR
jgi:hypothetical protein